MSRPTSRLVGLCVRGSCFHHNLLGARVWGAWPLRLHCRRRAHCIKDWPACQRRGRVAAYNAANRTTGGHFAINLIVLGHHGFRRPVKYNLRLG